MRVENAENSHWFGYFVKSFDNAVWLMKHSRKQRNHYEDLAVSKHTRLRCMNTLFWQHKAIKEDEDYKAFKGWAQDGLDFTARQYAA